MFLRCFLSPGAYLQLFEFRLELQHTCQQEACWMHTGSQQGSVPTCSFSCAEQGDLFLMEGCSAVGMGTEHRLLQLTVQSDASQIC